MGIKPNIMHTGHTGTGTRLDGKLCRSEAPHFTEPCLISTDYVNYVPILMSNCLKITSKHISL